MLAGAFVGEKPITTEATDFLVDRANGNPLYLRELVVMARERGLLVDDGEVYRLRDPDASAADRASALTARSTRCTTGAISRRDFVDNGEDSGDGIGSDGYADSRLASRQLFRRHCRPFWRPGSTLSSRPGSWLSNTWR